MLCLLCDAPGATALESLAPGVNVQMACPGEGFCRSCATPRAQDIDLESACFVPPRARVQQAHSFTLDIAGGG